MRVIHIVVICEKPPSKRCCIRSSQSVTLGTEASQPACTEISRAVTLGTEASQSECIEISRL